MSNDPDRLYIEKGDKELYESLLQGERFFSARERKDQFLFCMALGFVKKCRTAIDKKEGLIRAEYLKSSDMFLINSVALAEENDAEILLDKKKTYQIAEEYACAGIKILSSMVKSTKYGSFTKEFEVFINDLGKKKL